MEKNVHSTVTHIAYYMLVMSRNATVAIYLLVFSSSSSIILLINYWEFLVYTVTLIGKCGIASSQLRVNGWVEFLHLLHSVHVGFFTVLWFPPTVQKKKHAGGWSGYTNGPEVFMCVCMELCNRACIPNSVPGFSRERLQDHCTTDQDKAATEDEWMSELIGEVCSYRRWSRPRLSVSLKGLPMAEICQYYWNYFEKKQTRIFWAWCKSGSVGIFL